jgi:hypothetical protein
LELFVALMARVSADIASVGIKLTWDAVVWDVCQLESTNALMEHWLAPMSQWEEHLVLIANFSGFACNATIGSSLERAFTHIATRLSARLHTIVWVEPCMRSALKQLFRRVRGWVEGWMPWLRVEATETGRPPCERFGLRLREAQKAVQTSVTVVRCVRV